MKMKLFICLSSILFLQISCKSIDGVLYNKYPESRDWREQGAILPVPETGAVGVHPAMTNGLDLISAHLKIKSITKDLVKLSAQQIYDCSDDWCPGQQFAGNTTTVFQMIDKHGIEFSLNSEQDYPWTGECSHQCLKTNGTKYGFSVWGWNPDNTNLESWLIGYIQNGPVVVDVHAACDELQTYTTGVFKSDKCRGTADHTMMLVGYGTDQQTGDNYWILRNSWGKNWGEQGYIRVLRDSNVLNIGHGITFVSN